MRPPRCDTRARTARAWGRGRDAATRRAQSNHDIRVGIEIVGRAVLYPAKLIVEVRVPPRCVPVCVLACARQLTACPQNAGRSGEVIVAELLKQKSKTYGFNSQARGGAGGVCVRASVRVFMCMCVCRMRSTAT